MFEEFKPVKRSFFHSYVSGHYHLATGTVEQLPPFITAIDLRLDVDGWYPQNALSVTITRRRGKPIHLLARCSEVVGSVIIFSKIKQWGGRSPFEAAFTVRIEETGPSDNAPLLELGVTLRRTGKKILFRFVRIAAWFRTAQVECDYVEGVTSIVSLLPTAHLVHAPALPERTIDIKEVFSRAGIRLGITEGASAIPLSAAGGNQTWNYRELHDAMVSYWSQFSTTPQWSMWLLFANAFTESAAVNGIMFDSKKKSQRRGMAFFNDAMMFNSCADDHQSKNWIQRMKFFTVCHEMGHIFNLAHSWEKTQGKTWMREKNAPHARSFMNNPGIVDGGSSAFFSEFLYRFDDSELLFLRHAPESFVEMGNAVWFENHALTYETSEEHQPLTVTLRTGRTDNRYLFMEPVMLECRIKNQTNIVQSVDITEEMIADRCEVVITGGTIEGQKKLEPFSRCEYAVTAHQLTPGASLYSPLFISVGVNGWLIDTPGSYTVQVQIVLCGRMVVSNRCTMSVEPPAAPNLEKIAQDYFSEEVGRVLTFDGSRVLEGANTTLRRCLQNDVPYQIACHARLALAIPKQRCEKTIVFGSSRSPSVLPKVQTCSADPDYVHRELNALFCGINRRRFDAAVALGTIGYRKYADLYTGLLESEGKWEEALLIQKNLFSTLRHRGVGNRVILRTVLCRMQTIRNLKAGKMK